MTFVYPPSWLRDSTILSAVDSFFPELRTGKITRTRSTTHSSPTANNFDSLRDSNFRSFECSNTFFPWSALYPELRIKHHVLTSIDGQYASFVSPLKYFQSNLLYSSFSQSINPPKWQIFCHTSYFNGWLRWTLVLRPLGVLVPLHFTSPRVTML